MLRSPEIVIDRVRAVVGHGESLTELAGRAVAGLGDGVGAIVVASFSNSERFPSLAVRLAEDLKLPTEVPAIDLQMACSAYPYALWIAGGFAVATGRAALVVDGDVQSPLVDKADHATGDIFSDAVTVTRLRADMSADSPFAFYSRADEALTCSAAGPIKMDGFKVFTFVATEVSKFLRDFLAESGESTELFVPHQANPYMIRQLARTLSLEDRLLTIPDAIKNPGSCSVPMTLAMCGRPGRVLVAGFGAGLSAAAGIVRLAEDFKGEMT